MTTTPADGKPIRNFSFRLTNARRGIISFNLNAIPSRLPRRHQEPLPLWKRPLDRPQAI
jgi:hypothetical protein